MNWTPSFGKIYSQLVLKHKKLQNLLKKSTEKNINPRPIYNLRIVIWKFYAKSKNNKLIYGHTGCDWITQYSKTNGILFELKINKYIKKRSEQNVFSQRKFACTKEFNSCPKS